MIMDELIDKLHGIAVQLGIMNEFLSWLKKTIEEERSKDFREREQPQKKG